MSYSLQGYPPHVIISLSLHMLHLDRRIEFVLVPTFVDLATQNFVNIVHLQHFPCHGIDLYRQQTESPPTQ